MKLSIADLRAAGVSDKQIVDALQEAQAKIREQGRIRQRNHRARNASHGDARDLRDMRDRHIGKKEVSKKGSNKHTLDPNWLPSKENCAYAQDKGWTLDRIDAEADRFRNYWLGHGKPMADWDATWRNWVTSPYQTKGGGQNGQGRRHGSVLDAFDRLGEKLNAQGSFAEDYVPGSSGPEPLRLDQDMRPASLKLVPKG